MKKTFCSLLLLSALFGCNESAYNIDRVNTGNQQKIYAESQPVPFFKWSQDRDNLIQIYRMKNEALVTYSVVRAAGTGEILWHCPSIGFPIPADTQLTNPLQPFSGHNGTILESVVEQPEPNGLYSSKNTDGTYVICVMAKGVLSPQYTESKVEVFSRPVAVEKVDGKEKVVFLEGDPTMVISKGQK